MTTTRLNPVGDTASNLHIGMEKASVPNRIFKGLRDGVAFAFIAPGTILNSEGLQRTTKVFLSMFSLGAAFSEVVGLHVGPAKDAAIAVRDVLEGADFLQDSKEWGNLIKSIGHPRSWKITTILLATPRVLSVAFFTAGNIGQATLFVVSVVKNTYDASKYAVYAFGNVPIVGTVINGLFIGGLGYGIIAKGIDIVKDGLELHKVIKNRKTWEDAEEKLNAAKLDVEKNSAVDNLRVHYTEKFEQLEKDLNLLRAKKEAYDKAPDSAPKLDRKERTQLRNLESTKTQRHISMWKQRADRLAGADKLHAAREIFAFKIHEKFDLRQKNAIKRMAKNFLGGVINAGKIAVIVSSVAFLALGLVGLPFTIGLLSAGLVLNLAGLGNYSWWIFWGAKPLPRLEGYSLPRAAAAA